MKRIPFALAALVAFGGSALAAEGWGGNIRPREKAVIADHQAAPPKPLCQDFAKLKAEFAKDKDLSGTRFTPLTPGQFHFMAGVYAASPITPPGLPPGDGAQLMQNKDKAGILWTRGKLVCMSLVATGERDGDGHPQVAYMPLAVTPDLLKMLESVKTGAGETLSTDDTSGDVHL